MKRLNVSDRQFTLWKTLRLVFFISPVFTLLHTTACLIDGILPALSLAVNAMFVDRAIELFAGQGGTASMILPIVGILLILLWQNFSKVIIRYGEEARNRKVKVVLQTAFAEKLSNIEYIRLESPKTQDLIRRVALEPEEHVKVIVGSMTGIGVLFLQNITVLAVVTVNVWWAGILMIVGTVILGLLSLRAGEEDYQLQTEITEEKRKQDYLDSVAVDKTGVMERTLFSYTPFVSGQYQKLFSDTYQKEKLVLKKWAVRGKSGGILTVLFAVITLFLLMPGVRSGRITVGLYIAVMNAVFSVISTITWNLSFQMQNLAKGRAAAADMTAFCGLPEEKHSVLQTGRQETAVHFENLEFIDVHFRYPGSGREILKGISFRLEAGKHYAFVGKNGAGKTTAVKLMLGLYPDYEGEIRVNGKDVKEYTWEQRCALFACVWQDYAKYQLTMKENLCFGEEREPGEWEGALADVGLYDVVQKLPDGVNTKLGRLVEGGTDFSGGQWQRLAIARAFVSGGEFMIMDEPTASLDPMAERNVYRELAELCRNKTVVFVTHRLGAVRGVDTIFVLEDGRVKEQGTHQALMEQQGIYSQMYSSQQRWYV